MFFVVMITQQHQAKQKSIIKWCGTVPNDNGFIDPTRFVG